MRSNRKLPNPNLFTGEKSIATKLNLSDRVFKGASVDDIVFNFTELTTKQNKMPPSGESVYGDSKNTYTVNSFGFRSPEPEKQVDLVMAGCSQTFGVGVAQDKIWTEVLADSLGLSYVTYAAPGWSVQNITNAIMRHVDLYGKPKYVVALIPDFKRVIMPLRRDVNSFLGWKTANKKASDEILVSTLNYANNNPKSAYGPRYNFIKKPYDLYEVTPYEVPFYFSAQALATLISYCNASGIELIWSSWSQPILDLYKCLSLEGYNELDMSGFIYRETTERRDFPKKYSDCHLDLKAQYEENFNESFGNSSHMTLHQHVHLAEQFEAFIKAKK
jgi:hypothetical protein